jgi:nucleoside triphosphate diphosphatase
MSSEKFETLLRLMERLRGPGGCPWDREQTLETLRPYLIEETYEVLEAIDRRDWAHLSDELGDLQLQIVFQSQIAAEEGHFTIADVLDRITDKLVRRHPHVFGSESLDTAGEVVHRWEEIKQQEKRRTAPDGSAAGQAEALLAAVPHAQPALLEAEQLSKRAAKVGFDWERPEDMIDKIQEESRELLQARESLDAGQIEDEVGDLLFMVVNLARRLKISPELALKRANRKFRHRFGHVEERLREQGRTPASSDLAEMEELWQQAKKNS